jgi:threonine dehydrogenase-like Zn-dependent dehydrogenase
MSVLEMLNGSSSQLMNSGSAPRASAHGAETMRAIRLTGPRRLELQEVIKPQPAASQLRVRIEGSGLCGSSLPVWQGRPWFNYPLEPGAPGHEAWGWIDAVGAAVQGVRVGERVALLSTHAFAEYDLTEAGAVVAVPEGARIFPGEALGCAVNVFRRSAVEQGQTVAIIGIGFIGALLVQMAAQSGARVIAISRRPFALETARLCGAELALAIGDDAQIVRRVNELTGGRGCERVIEAAGEQQTLDLASQLMAVRGRLVIAGYHQDSPRTVDLQLWNWRGIDVVNAHERETANYVDGMSSAASMVTRGSLEPEPLYTHGFSLEQAEGAFTALEQRPDKFLKAWIRVTT